MIQRLGPQNVAAFIAEPIVGATMGAVPPAEGYYDRIQEICKEHGVLLIMDEVMVGCGRTGKYFASEHYNIRPDMICIAKGIAAGIQPLAAMLCSAEIYGAIKEGSGFFFSMGTLILRIHRLVQQDLPFLKRLRAETCFSG